MKVLQINAVYNILSTGRTTAELHKALTENGIDSYVAYSRPNTAEGENLYRIAPLADVKLHGLFSRLLGKQGYFSHLATKKLLKYIDGINPDIVHLRNLHGNYINIPMLLEYLAEKKIATVVTLHDFFFITGKCVYFTKVNCDKWQSGCGDCPNIHNGNPTWFFDRTRTMFEDRKRLFSAIDKLAFIGVSDWAAEEAAKSPIAENATLIKRIYNWIDFEKFKVTDPAAQKHKLELDGKFVILGVASTWDERKGFSDFIRLSETLGDDEIIVLIGGLPDGVSLPDNIIGVNTTDSLDELISYYNAADVFVTFSTEETFGKVSAEALSCGTPVICYNSSANPELVGEGCGYIVDQNDFDSVRQAIEKIKADTKCAYMQHCVEYAHKNFDKDECIKQYIMLYRELTE